MIILLTMMLFPLILYHTGKINTQKIERKHLSFRTRLKRLARKTICFSKSLSMHNILLGLLIIVRRAPKELRDGI